MFPSQLFRGDQRISPLVFDRRGAYLDMQFAYLLSLFVYLCAYFDFDIWTMVTKEAKEIVEIVK